MISDRDIRSVVRALLDEDPWTIVVPASVYRALAKRCKCAGCVPNVVDIITEVTEEYHRQLADSRSEPLSQRRTMPRTVKQGGRHERRFTGHRAAK
jgi:hypothetical protein